jgi:uncharacterized protein YpmB
MPGAARAEIYFIAAMMILILVICGAAVYYFFKTYRKEMREKAERETDVVSNDTKNGGANDRDEGR